MFWYFFSFSFSGMLLAFIQLKQMAKLKKDPQPGKIGYYVFYYYFHRFWRCCVENKFTPNVFFFIHHWLVNRQIILWFIFGFRLTPMYMIILMIYTCLTTYLGDGPMWPKQIESAQNCRESWWTNLLYVNNLVLVNKQVRMKEISCKRTTWNIYMYIHTLSQIISVVRVVSHF